MRLSLSVLRNGDVQGCDHVHELLALFAFGELIGYGGNWSTFAKSCSVKASIRPPSCR
jgi:hypothetical protein